MKPCTLTGVMLVAMTSLQAATDVELRLTTELPERLPYMYEDRELSLVNASRTVVLLPENAFEVRLLIKSEDGWLECRPVVLADPMPRGDIEWKEMNPTDAMSLPIPASRCLCQGDGGRTCDDWIARPGVHRFKAVLRTRTDDVDVPKGAFAGVLESNVIEIRITEPTGVDATAVAWAKGSTPLRPEVLREFPTSTYAAFYVYRKAARIRDTDPTAISELIERGRYPGGNSVPSPDGWKSLDSEGVARWQVEWGQRILREHPDFPFRDEVRVAVALAQMALGETPDARRAIEGVAKAGDSPMARWSREFLEKRPAQN